MAVKSYEMFYGYHKIKQHLFYILDIMLYTIPTCTDSMLCFVPHYILNFIIKSHQQYSDDRDIPKSV